MKQKLQPKLKQPEKHSSKTFLASVKAMDSGNAVIGVFLSIMERVTRNQASFSLLDVLYHAKKYDLPVQEVKELFEKWTDKEVSLQRLERIDGCYSVPIFSVVSIESFLD